MDHSSSLRAFLEFSGARCRSRAGRPLALAAASAHLPAAPLDAAPTTRAACGPIRTAPSASLQPPLTPRTGSAPALLYISRPLTRHPAAHSSNHRPSYEVPRTARFSRATSQAPP
ncbi:hypothetical protein, partial [Burkholderia cenocepacia]|uniref:hypothetical protein n=1 Tax=Burkholderia cenocepacia TaxID=95486 RepID=UPI00406C0FC6